MYNFVHSCPKLCKDVYLKTLIRLREGSAKSLLSPSEECPGLSSEEIALKVPKAKNLAIIIVLGWLVFVFSYLALWEHEPSWQVVLNRISWSTADFIALAATGLALYTYHLFQKGLESNIVAQFMEWAMDPKNQDALDKVIRNVLATKATGQAFEIAIELAKRELIKGFEGYYGAQKREFVKGFKGQVPDGIKVIIDHPWFDHFMKGIGVVDTILKALKGGPPGGSSGESE